MDRIVVPVAATLKKCQAAIRTEDTELVASGESVMSALIVWLRYEEALLDPELEVHLKNLAQ